MKKIITTLTLLLMFAGCLQEDIKTSHSAEVIEIIQNGRDYSGTVKNTGETDIYNVMVSVNIYRTNEKKEVIGTLLGSVINSSVLEPGESDSFKMYFTMDRLQSIWLENYTYKVIYDF